MLSTTASTRLPHNPDPVASEWDRLHATTPETVRVTIAALIDRHAAELAGLFYETLMGDPEASALLSHELVGARLHGSLQRWMRELVPLAGPANYAEIAARQKMIGAVHARVQVPLHLVMRAARILTSRLLIWIEGTELEREELSRASAYLFGAFDIAVELMASAFIVDTKRTTKDSESYRLFAVGQDVTLERETQRSALLEWSQSILLPLATGGAEAMLPGIGASDFGLWAQHRAGILFQDSQEQQRIMALIRQIDSELLPDLSRARREGATDLPARIEVLQAAVKEIRYLVNEAFQNVIGLENGRDPLTRTLNRRFLPSVMHREIGIASRNGGVFSVLMIDLDHFKSVNDRLGHPAGDAVLRQAAEIILETCRQSDFVFRYGGEEFLAVLVECGSEAALNTAERIRARLKETQFHVADGQSLRMTASFGIAVFDGHPDYQRLVERADQALYLAKNSGRDRVVLQPA